MKYLQICNHPAVSRLSGIHSEYGILLKIIPFFLLLLAINLQTAAQVSFSRDSIIHHKYIPDRRIDNMGYWGKLARMGFVPVTPKKAIPEAIYKSSKITDAPVATFDSPDVPVTLQNFSQSENSLFISPNDRFFILNSNNSTPNPYPGYFLGADGLYSEDAGETWEGQTSGVGSSNMGDPSTAINSNGRWFVGYIHTGGGQALSYSDDGGVTWKIRGIAAPPQVMGGLLDKPHLWIDNCPTSPYMGRLYNGWTVFGGPDQGSVQISRSTDNGLAWQYAVKVSDSVKARSHNQGVNIATGPNGEVYAVWAAYDDFPGDEKALGFARSFNGGQAFEQKGRILNNIRGIRIHETNKLMRTNSFPSMAVDVSNSPWRGTIYVVWANVNVPGVNTGTGIDVYLIRSTDSGDTWSEPIRINQDLFGTGKQHYFPWITCDPASGNLSVIFYDDRDCLPTQAETWVAVSTDGGYNWQDFRVSDVAFTPAPVTGLTDNYFGDYLNISAREGMVYPCWTDNRMGWAMTYVSPFRLGPQPGQVYISYASHILNDSAGGNMNGRADFGENLTLSLTLRNMGNVASSAVTVTLSADSPYITFNDSTEFYGHFGAAGVISRNNAFSFSISDSIPDHSRVIFTVRAVDHHDSVYLSNFTIPVNAPGLDISAFTVDDPEGNSNHALDPKEKALITLKITNNSSYPAENPAISLQSPQPYVQVKDTLIHIPNLLPGEFTYVTFPVKIGNIDQGAPALFLAKAAYSFQQTSRLFALRIGQITEDWETGGYEKMNWRRTGNNTWKIDSIFPYEGRYYAKSGSIGINQSSVLFIDFNVLTNDSISFYYKVSSEPYFDVLNFYIDDNIIGQWSGEREWSKAVFPVTPGKHRFKWEYSKDMATSVGLDGAFLDYIHFPSTQYTTVFAGNDVTICPGDNFRCNGSATFYDSLMWISSGTGSFDNPAQLRPIYFPSAADIAAGSLQLVLKVYGGSFTDFISDTLTLAFYPVTSANAGPDAAVCFGESYRLDGTSATNYKYIMWKTSGDGTFDETTRLMPVYTHGPEDAVKGYADLILKVFSEGEYTCGTATDSLKLTIHPLPVVSIPDTVTLCAGFWTEINALHDFVDTYTWLPGNVNDPVVRIDTMGNGLSDRIYKVNFSDRNGCRSSDSLVAVFQACDERQQAGEVAFRVFPNPVKGMLTIELFSDSRQDVRLKLDDDRGRNVMSLAAFSTIGRQLRHIDVSRFRRGVYTLTLINSKEKGSLKVVIL